MYKKWSAAGAALVVALLLAVPAGAVPGPEQIGPYPDVTLPTTYGTTVEPGVWDLTQGPVTISYILDLSGAPNVAYNWNWDYMGKVGLYGGGAGAQMVGFLSDWENRLSQFPVYPDYPGTSDMDDKFNLQRFPVPGSYDEAMYDVDCTGTPTIHAVPNAPGDNHGVWFDRDGVDQWQATYWDSVNGGTYNTNGIYNVVLTFTKMNATTGAVCATVNGIKTGYYSSGWKNAPPEFYPAGISFAATPEQMEAMQVKVAGASDGGSIVVKNLMVSGVPSYTHDIGDCLGAPASSEDPYPGYTYETTAFVSSNEALASVATDLGVEYTVEVSGTYFAGGAGIWDIQADVEYSQDKFQRVNSLPWTDDVRNYGNALYLKVDGVQLDWGDFSATHTYAQVLTADSLTSFALQIEDTGWVGNNNGGLCVRLFKDSTSPAITITTPSEGAVYFLNQNVLADYACTDASGIAACDGNVPDGAAIDTSSVGAKTFTVNATDNAGNTSTASTNYTVVHNFTGFFRPVDNPDVALNTVKAGQAIPVKFSLGGDEGLTIFAAGYPLSTKIACDTSEPQDAIEVTLTAGGSSLSYDALTDTYTYVWKTDKAWANTCRQLNVKLVDGTVHLANFKFIK